ncbi:Anti-sigma regulatory factor (Ser/Thr protein kinase) [Jatrophihabitans endophyticus]|uniref:Anti-sigma regulatory factor (Ser/Thr protein kinase) n=1 Tax=Jatrophihabitans endophyticus TaxID=1206085 RepID=A0A1M5IVK0_9ACTN|nr:GAF domain-containing protein [Jatrophihabitans endophyticus]SHG31813.1 Anti-sigma regulatory factor (Ser/Thr protein kinase) [Jatrophihabitans endophyticus]
MASPSSEGVPTAGSGAAADARHDVAEHAAGNRDVAWFEAGTQAAALARAQVRSTLLVHAVERAVIAQAELLTSELVTNVVRHARSERVGVVVTADADAVGVEVHEDRPSAEPRHVVASVTAVPDGATTGRGMGIVDRLATEWGVTRRHRTTTTWFRIEVGDRGVGTSAAADGRQVGPPAPRTARDRSRLLLRVVEAVGRAATPEQVADTITHTVRDQVGAVCVGIALTDTDDGVLRFLSLDPVPVDRAARWIAFPLDGSSPVARAALEADPVFHVNRDAAERATPGVGAHLDAAGIDGVAHLPLTVAGASFGTLAVGWAGRCEIDADTRALLLLVAGFAAQALARR